MSGSFCRWPRFSVLMLVGCSVLPFASANERYDHELCLLSCRQEHTDCVRSNIITDTKKCLSPWKACNSACGR